MARPLKADAFVVFVGAGVDSHRGELAWDAGGRLGSVQGKGWSVCGGLSFCFLFR